MRFRKPALWAMATVTAATKSGYGSCRLASTFGQPRCRSPTVFQALKTAAHRGGNFGGNSLRLRRVLTLQIDSRRLSTRTRLPTLSTMHLQRRECRSRNCANFRRLSLPTRTNTSDASMQTVVCQAFDVRHGRLLGIGTDADPRDPGGQDSRAPGCPRRNT